MSNLRKSRNSNTLRVNSHISQNTNDIILNLIELESRLHKFSNDIKNVQIGVRRTRGEPTNFGLHMVPDQHSVYFHSDSLAL